jgi:hypothetical protein
VRQGGKVKEEAWDAPVEGVPPWLHSALEEWLYRAFVLDATRGGPSQAILHAIELNLRLPLVWAAGVRSAWATLQTQFRNRPESFLDVVDYALMVMVDERGASPDVKLETILSASGSIWTVAPDGGALTRRVGHELAEAARQVVSDPGSAGALIASAWKHIYGRDPSPSTGYSEAVRAIEAAACHVIIPNDGIPTLGKAIKALGNAPVGKFVTVFPSDAVGGNPLEAVRKLMELVWTSQTDRHGTNDESVPLSISQHQAEAALHAAVTLVLWFQRGFIQLASP